jgi:methanogenic corrinoid protein MtbC1
MIRWCAYCQTFQGERAPFEDYSVTHTICSRCYDEEVFREADDIQARIEPIAQFYKTVESIATGAVASPDALIDEGSRLGIAPFDLLVGVLQPALSEVGERWARSEITYHDERRLTETCGAILDRLAVRYPEIADRRDASSPDVILASASGNAHTVGLRMVEFFLLARGARVLLFVGGSADELVRKTCETKPKILGIGVTLADQLDAAAQVANRVARQVGDVTDVVIGGAAIRAGARLPPGTSARACSDFRALLEHL